MQNYFNFFTEKSNQKLFVKLASIKKRLENKILMTDVDKCILFLFGKKIILFSVEICLRDDFIQVQTEQINAFL